MTTNPTLDQPRRSAAAMRIENVDYLARIREAHRCARRCTRCIYDDKTPAITFDATGICNYCRTCERLEEQYPTGREGERRLEQMVDEIKLAGRGKPFDVVVGVSGGCDSSYML